MLSVSVANRSFRFMLRRYGCANTEQYFLGGTCCTGTGSSMGWIPIPSAQRSLQHFQLAEENIQFSYIKCCYANPSA